jgi:hypothetical protein
MAGIDVIGNAAGDLDALQQHRGLHRLPGSILIKRAAMQPGQVDHSNAGRLGKIDRTIGVKDDVAERQILAAVERAAPLGRVGVEEDDAAVADAAAKFDVDLLV